MGSRLIQVASGAGTALSNTVTETSLAQKVFAAGELVPGKVYRLAGSVRTTSDNSTDTLTLRVRWGTSATPASNTNSAASAAVDQAAGDVSVFAFELEVQSTTRAVLRGFMMDPDAEGSASLLKAYHEILTIAQTSAYYFDVTGTWSVASASNSCQAESFSVIESV